MARLTTLPKQLADVRAKLISYAPQPNETYYGFTSGSARVDVGASITVYVLDNQGVPAAGINVYNVRPDGRFEMIQTGGNGQATFYLGRGSYFFSGQDGPHTVFIGEGGNSEELQAPKVMGDRIGSMGLPEGHHVDYVITFRQMTAGRDDGVTLGAPTSTTPIVTPVTTTPVATTPTATPISGGSSLGDAIAHLEQAIAILRNLRG